MVQEGNKSSEAVDWLAEDSTRTQAEASRKFGVARSTISRAIEQRAVLFNKVRSQQSIIENLQIENEALRRRLNKNKED